MEVWWKFKCNWNGSAMGMDNNGNGSVMGMDGNSNCVCDIVLMILKEEI